MIIPDIILFTEERDIKAFQNETQIQFLKDIPWMTIKNKVVNEKRKLEKQCEDMVM